MDSKSEGSDGKERDAFLMQAISKLGCGICEGIGSRVSAGERFIEDRAGSLASSG